jgi:transposase-like protein
LASPFSTPRFARDEPALLGVLVGIKLVTCPHCRRSGALIGHGFLRGYAECGSERVVRGRRFFCSDRYLGEGCGRTFSVALTTVLAGFVVRTLTLLGFAQAVLAGLTRRAAWLRAARGAFSLSSGYRLWRRLQAAQSALRARLSREAAAPASAAREPLAQLLVHFSAVVGCDDVDLLAAFQVRTQHGLFDTRRV